MFEFLAFLQEYVTDRQQYVNAIYVCVYARNKNFKYSVTFLCLLNIFLFSFQVSESLNYIDENFKSLNGKIFFIFYTDFSLNFQDYASILTKLILNIQCVTKGLKTKCIQAH